MSKGFNHEVTEECLELASDGHLNNSVSFAMSARRRRYYQSQMAQGRLAKLLDDSTVAGLAHASTATTETSRLFWVVLLFSGFIGFGCSLFFLVQRFLSKPVLTIFNPETDDFIWPDITFCDPMSPIPFWIGAEIKQEWDRLKQRTEPYLNLTYLGRPLSSMIHFLLMSSLRSDLLKSGDVSAAIPIVSLSIQSDGLTESISYFDTFRNVTSIHEGFFTRLHVGPFPIPCFTFNPANLPELMKKTDQSRKLQMSRYYLALDHASYKHFDNDYEDRNAHVYISYPNYSLPIQHFYLLPPGTTTTLFIRMTRLKRLKNKSGCNDKHFKMELYDSELLKTRQFFGSYDDCRHHVSQQIFIEKCGCYSPTLPIVKTDQDPPRLCLNITLFNARDLQQNLLCMTKIMQEFGSSTAYQDEVQKQCSKYRSPVCDEVHYTLNHNSIAWSRNVCESRRNYLRALVPPSAPNGSDEKFLLNNLAILNVQREFEKVDVSVEEYEYPTSQFISDVGGLMGLWLGLSIVGCFELVEIAIVFAHYLATIISSWSERR